MKTKATNIERRINPGLPVIKEGWLGNYYINGRFHNDSVEVRPPVWDVVKWKLSSNPQKHEKLTDTFSLKQEDTIDLNIDNDGIVWLGHSTFYIRINGVSLITDPVFYNLPSNKRRVDQILPDSSFYPIDYILCSHDHRDHFDLKSIQNIAALNPHTEVLLPLGAERFFTNKKMRKINRQEAGWYQEYAVNEKLQIVFLPSKHWGRRGVFDFNRTLWGSFIIISDSFKIYFCGDSGYGNHFKEIHSLFGNIDICILPIGAYAPEWLMSQSHMNPEEAVQAFIDLGGTHLIPSHYGTYDLSDEPLGEPLLRFESKMILIERNNSLHKLSIGKNLPFRNVLK
jgi:L-ascorbate metabolism protein UlaG (beta-lactamase superfamily)